MRYRRCTEWLTEIVKVLISDCAISIHLSWIIANKISLHCYKNVSLLPDSVLSNVMKHFSLNGDVFEYLRKGGYHSVIRNLCMLH